MFLSILLILLFFGFVLLLMLPSIVASFISSVLSLFGIGRKSSQRHNRENRWQGTDTAENASVKNGKQGERRKKMFDKDEGEYVDFEEIK